MRLVTRRIISESINALRTLTECCILSKKCNFLSDLWIDNTAITGGRQLERTEDAEKAIESMYLETNASTS